MAATASCRRKPDAKVAHRRSPAPARGGPPKSSGSSAPDRPASDQACATSIAVAGDERRSRRRRDAQRLDRRERADRRPAVGRPRGAQLPARSVGERPQRDPRGQRARRRARARARSPRPRRQARAARARLCTRQRLSADPRRRGQRLVVELVQPRQRVVGGQRDEQRPAVEHGLVDSGLGALAGEASHTPTSARDIAQRVRRRRSPRASARRPAGGGAAARKARGTIAAAVATGRRRSAAA